MNFWMPLSILLIATSCFGTPKQSFSIVSDPFPLLNTWHRIQADLHQPVMRKSPTTHNHHPKKTAIFRSQRGNLIPLAEAYTQLQTLERRTLRGSSLQPHTRHKKSTIQAGRSPLAVECDTPAANNILLPPSGMLALFLAFLFFSFLAPLFPFSTYIG